MDRHLFRTTLAGVAVLMAGLAGAPGATAAPVDLVSAGNHIRFADGPGTTGGGEFTVTVSETLDSFITFCLQKTETMNFSDTFTVGGVTRYTVSEELATGGNAAGRDYLSRQTQYLYTHFRNGTLPGYVSGSTASANDLQRAFWWFEGEAANPGNAFVALANAAVANGYAGNSRVRVMNLYYSNGRDAQDQLVMVPEPAETALLGVGLTLAAWRLRRRTSTPAA